MLNDIVNISYNAASVHKFHNQHILFFNLYYQLNKYVHKVVTESEFLGYFKTARTFLKYRYKLKKSNKFDFYFMMTQAIIIFLN